MRRVDGARVIACRPDAEPGARRAVVFSNPARWTPGIVSAAGSLHRRHARRFFTADQRRPGGHSGLGALSTAPGVPRSCAPIAGDDLDVLAVARACARCLCRSRAGSRAAPTLARMLRDGAHDALMSSASAPLPLVTETLRGHRQEPWLRPRVGGARVATSLISARGRRPVHGGDSAPALSARDASSSIDHKRGTADGRAPSLVAGCASWALRHPAVPAPAEKTMRPAPGRAGILTGPGDLPRRPRRYYHWGGLTPLSVAARGRAATILAGCGRLVASPLRIGRAPGGEPHRRRQFPVRDLLRGSSSSSPPSSASLTRGTPSSLFSPARSAPTANKLRPHPTPPSRRRRRDIFPTIAMPIDLPGDGQTDLVGHRRAVGMVSEHLDVPDVPDARARRRAGTPTHRLLRPVAAPPASAGRADGDYQRARQALAFTKAFVLRSAGRQAPGSTLTPPWPPWHAAPLLERFPTPCPSTSPSPEAGRPWPRSAPTWPERSRCSGSCRGRHQ